MASKRKWDTFDPNKSDSDDLDYGDEGEPRGKPQRRSKKSKTGSRKPAKRRRETYGDSDDDIEADSEEDSEEVSFAEDSDEEEPVETNPRTGRSVRSTAKKPVKYEDPSDEDIEAEESDHIGPTPSRPKLRLTGLKKSSLIVKLKVPAYNMESGRVTRARAGSSRPVSKREPTPLPSSAMGTRRSSRISHNEEDNLVALTDSGKHEQVTRQGTATPEPPSRRPTSGSKGLKKLPSAIMEASQEQSQEAGAVGADLRSQLETAAEGDAQEEPTLPPADEETRMEEAEEEEEQVVEESMDEDDEAPVVRGGRTLRIRRKASTPPTSQPPQAARRSLRARKSGVEPSSDFEPDAEAEADVEEDLSDDELLKPPRGGTTSNDDSQGGRSSRRSGRLTRKTASQRSRSRRDKSDDDEIDLDEVADEAADLEDDIRRNRRERKRPARRTEIAFEPNLRSRGNRPDYRILRPELLQQMEEDDGAPGLAPVATPSRNRRGGGGGAYRSLFSTFGPFGGAGGPPPVFGGPEGIGAAGGVDSDSSDDEGTGGFKGGPQGIGGAVGMTPTSAYPKPFAAQAHGSDAIQGPGGGPPGLGKVKDKKALADADPLGVDPNVSFDGVGGLDGHINQLKEMVALPLLYPEVFQQFHITPPRGVLFHGPPGTGKTLLARALASSVSSQGKKVTFYMRKGADALSKWVGEAEKQLRLLFEEARKNQPSIIFFDEIDGLAPVRSSKQEQIHASIVATLLALMDGMDGRGQVIVIGATNRPDSVDPALRRPGRFDREFYFPLPDALARRSIIDIHTKGWDPPLKPDFKDQLAELTRGYGGADLRALCTEAALNAVQGTYPQIYSSDKKLLIDPSTIKVLAKDFMISVNKIVPSSERSAASGATPLRKDVEPLLRKPLHMLSERVDEAIPRKRKATALEEAMYDDRDDEAGFERENMQMQFEASRVFRPRLLIRGFQGMGQQYLGAALLSKLEGLHVQNFDLATLMKDSTRVSDTRRKLATLLTTRQSTEAAIVQQFEEVKRHKPSVIYIPNVDLWYRTLGDSAVRTFTGLIRGLAPTEPVLLLGVMEEGYKDEDEETKDFNAKAEKQMLRDLFGYSAANQYELQRPDKEARSEYFESTMEYIRKAPSDFPEGQNRKRRKLADLPVAPEPEAPKGPSKADLKAQKRKDRQTLNMLKLHIQSVMDQIKLKYKKFRTPIIEDRDIAYLYDEQDPEVLTTDLTEEERQRQQLFRPYERADDGKGVPGLQEVASGKFYYNLEIVTIEKRLSNGYYKRPKDFLADIKHLAKDATTAGDHDRTLKAKEMLANVEVDMLTLEQQQPGLVAECETLYEREQDRERARLEKEREAQRRGEDVPTIIPNVPPPGDSKTTTEEGSGPVRLGPEVPGGPPQLPPVTPSRIQVSPNSNAWSTTGTSGQQSHQTNGSTVPSKPQHEGSEMYSPAEDPSQQYANTQGQQWSQRTAHTRVAQGSQVEQYHNSASTTTSGQKTSDKSNRSSGPHSLNTQLSNGVRHGDHPDFSILPEAQGGSQLPDTQEPSSQASSQPMAPPPHRRSSITALLNNPAQAAQPPSPTAATPTQRIICDLQSIENFHHKLVDSSSGLSVEQLEQVNAAMMEVIWRKRGEWNRNQVLLHVQTAFNATIADIEACQNVMGPSQEKS